MNSGSILKRTLELLLGKFDGPQQAFGFAERFLVFRFGDTVGDDAGSGLHINGLSLHDQRSEGDAGIHVSGEVDVPDRARVGASAVTFLLVDDLHCPHFWCAGNRAGRKPGP